MAGYTEARYPIQDVAFGYRSGFDVFDGNHLRPTCETVDDCQKVFAALGLWEGTHEVNVYVVKSPLSRFKSLEGRSDMCLDFGSLAAQTRPCPVNHLFV